MNEDDSSADKSFEPTPKRLEDARKKGDVPNSADLTTAGAYIGFIAVGATVGGGTLLALGTDMRFFLDQADRMAAESFSGGGTTLVGGALQSILLPLIPWFAGPAFVAALAVVAQGSFVLAPDKISFKGSRLSPLAALRNKFGPNGLVEFAKSAVKLIIYMIVLGVHLTDSLPDMLNAARMAPSVLLTEMMRLTLELVMMVAVVATALGLFDLIWQRLQFRQRHMMTRKELMDEMKESEGDPYLKQQRRQRAVSLAMNQMIADVPKADVVIVNPTHYAVALKWDRSQRRAPVCIAKGVDEIAARIREAAALHGIPIHSDPPTARALHAGVEIGQEIPRDQYRAVAAAIRFAERIRKKAAAR